MIASVFDTSQPVIALPKPACRQALLRTCAEIAAENSRAGSSRRRSLPRPGMAPPRTRRRPAAAGDVRRLVRQIFCAGKEPHEGTPLSTDMIADGPLQHRITGLQSVEDRTDRSLACDFDRHLAVRLRQCSQMRREHHTNHESVCTSTESTAGRSRTMGAQLSPASADAYTCPPVVPK